MKTAHGFLIMDQEDLKHVLADGIYNTDEFLSSVNAEMFMRGLQDHRCHTIIITLRDNSNTELSNELEKVEKEVVTNGTESN